MSKTPPSGRERHVDWEKVGQWTLDLVKAFRGGPGRFYAFTFAAGMIAVTGAPWWAPLIERFAIELAEKVFQHPVVSTGAWLSDIPPIFVASSGLVICLLSMMGFQRALEKQLATSHGGQIAIPADKDRTDLDQKFDDASDIQSLILFSIEALSSLTKTDYNQIFLISTQSHSKQLLCVGRRIANGKQDYRVAAFSGLLGKSFSSGRLINVPDVREWINYMQAVLQTRSELVVPIKIEGRIVGLLNSESEVVGHYTADHEKSALSIADAIGRNLYRVGWREDLGPDDLPWLGEGQFSAKPGSKKSSLPPDCPKCKKGHLVSISEFTKASEGTFTRHYTTKQCSNCGELIVT